MKVKTLRAYLIGLPEEFDNFNVRMTKHQIEEGQLKSRTVEPIYGTIMQLEKDALLLLDKDGADFFDNIGKTVEDKLHQ